MFLRPDNETAYPVGPRPEDGLIGTYSAALQQGAWSGKYSRIEVKSKCALIAAPSLHESGVQYQWLPGWPGEAGRDRR